MPYEVEVTKVSKSGKFVNVEYNFKGKASTKKLPLFGANKDVAESAMAFLPGEKVQVTSAKNADTGFADWVAISGSGASGEVRKDSGVSTNINRASVGSTSTYPTREERELTQVMIVRQSCLSTATKVLDSKKGEYTADDVIATAEELVSWVCDFPLRSEQNNSGSD